MVFADFAAAALEDEREQHPRRYNKLLLQRPVRVEEHPSPARVAAAVARIKRRASAAELLLREVFGCDTAVDSALRHRVHALEPEDEHLKERASELAVLVSWCIGIADTLELEAPAAAALGVDLASIAAELQIIAASATSSEATIPSFS